MKRVYYYNDEVNDDFASTNGKINSDTVNGDYRYSHPSVGWKIASFFAYRVFATPLVWLYTKVWLGVRVKNRRALRKVKGCFVYMNHTQNIADAFLPTISAFPKRAYVVTGPETVSIKGIRVLVALLGAVPLPSALFRCPRRCRLTAILSIGLKRLCRKKRRCLSTRRRISGLTATLCGAFPTSRFPTPAARARRSWRRSRSIVGAGCSKSFTPT